MSALDTFNIPHIRHFILCYLLYYDIQNLCIVMGYIIPKQMKKKYIDAYINYGVTFTDTYSISRNVQTERIRDYISLRGIISSSVNDIDNILPSLNKTIIYKQDKIAVETDICINRESTGIESQVAIRQYITVEEGVHMVGIDTLHTFNVNRDWKEQVVSQILDISLFYCMPRHTNLEDYCIVSKWEYDREEQII